MEYQTIRRYKKQRKPGRFSNVWLVIMILVVAAFVGVFVMSLLGIGLFKDRPGAEDSESVSESETEETTEEITTEADTQEDIVLPDITYTELEKDNSDVRIGDLILIDATHPYVFPKKTFYGAEASPNIDYESFENKSDYIVAIYNTRNIYVDGYKVATTNIMLRLDVIEQLSKLMKAFYTKTGDNTGLITGGYRSYEGQQSLAENNPSAAAPGCSDYHAGMTFLIEKYSGGKQSDLLTSATGGWFKANMCNYGFIMRYPSYSSLVTGYNIPNQIRYVGNVAATHIMNNGLCLEEYLQDMRENHASPDRALFVSCSDGWDYITYYTPASDGETTRIPVPEGYGYTVSGDNIGGFIVTVKVRERPTE